MSELPKSLLAKPALITDGVMHKEASTITDIQNSSDNTEVHLISLVSEQIPKYRLRSESPAGYCQQDWLQTPLLSPSAAAELSPELYKQTFDYFMISGNRLSQMTQTYHDIEAVTRLLEEKERDLELAARIGQTLLQKNRDAVLYSQKLEEDLQNALEQVSQLKHEINLKENLLHTYANDETDSSGAPSPIKEFRKLGGSGLMGHFEELHTRITRLGVDNDQLRLDKVQYEQESEELETQEHELMSDALKEMDENARDCNSLVSEELTQKNEETVKLQEEITRLLTQVVDMQRKQKQVALENEELQQHLFAANSAQLELTQEIQILEDQYEELSNALSETREEARTLRDSQSSDMTQPIPFSDSLAAELGFDTCTKIGTSETEDGEFLVKSDGFHEDKAVTQSTNLNILEQEVSKSPNQRAFDTVKFVNSFRTLVKPLSTQPRQNRPIPTPFPLLSQRCDVSPSASRFNSSGASSGGMYRSCLTSTPNSEVGKNPCLDPESTASFQSHAVTPSKFASSALSPYVKLSARMHAVSKCHSTIPGLQSLSELSHHMDGEASNIPRKTSGSRQSLTHVGRTTPNLGRPGIPGTEDLEKAIRKLALRRESLRYIQLQRFRGQSFGANFSTNNMLRSETSSNDSHLASHNPSSPEVSSDRCKSGTKRSPKLQIVKPLEGSVTLNQWKYLAAKDRTLQLSRETRCGVITRDKIIDSRSKVVKSTSKTAMQQTNQTSANFIQRNVQPTATAASSVTLNKVLENTRRVNKMIKSNKVISTCGKSSSVSVGPGKNFAFTPTKYTYAYSNVKYPDDDFETLSSNFTPGARMSPMHSSPQSVSNSVKSPSSSKSYAIMVKDNTRTCSTEMGIAQLLKEHGAKAIDEVASSTANCKEDISTFDLKSSKGKTKPDAASSTSALRMNFPGPLVWNRTLRRSFLLYPNSVGQNFMSKNDGASVSAKPETPPNSPSCDFEENFAFFDDGYLSPEPDQETPPRPQRTSLDILDEAAGSFYLEERQEPLGASVTAVEVGRSNVDDSRNPDWSQLHGSSGALNETFADDELKTLSEQR